MSKKVLGYDHSDKLLIIRNAKIVIMFTAWATSLIWFLHHVFLVGEVL